MVIDRIKVMLASCGGSNFVLPPTELYNETWFLRLVLEWFSNQDLPEHRISFHEEAKWFSEALIPTAFLPRFRKDPLGESWTHADGVIGHFEIGNKGRGDLSLSGDATQFIVLEAKMFSRLSTGVTHASYFDQAARTVACMAETMYRALVLPGRLSTLGFYVLAPQSQIDKGVFDKEMKQESIRAKVERRVKEYEGEKDQWFHDCFQPTLSHINIGCVSWEQLLVDIREHDPSYATKVSDFYKRCLLFNSPDLTKGK